MLSLYKKFLIYCELHKNKSIHSISKSMNISRSSVYKIKKEGFLNIKSEQKIILDYVQKYPFKNISEISKELNLSKSFVYRVLKKHNVFVFRNSKIYSNIANFLAQINDIENLKKFILYFNCYNISPDFILHLKEIPFELKIFEFEYVLKNFTENYKLSEIENEIDNYLEKLRKENKLFLYYRALSCKFDILILRKNYSGILEYYDENIENLISVSLKAKLLSKIANAYSLESNYRNAISILKKLKKLYKKLSYSERKNISEYIFAVYYNIGNFKLAYKNSRTNLSKIMSAFSLGKYENVINLNFKELSKHAYFIVNYAKALSYLFLGKPNEAISTISLTYENMNIKEIEDVMEFYYVFFIIYHKFLGTNLDKHYFEEAKNLLKDKIDPHIYAIITGDVSKLNRSPKSLIIMYWIKGRLNRAIEISEKFNAKTLLRYLILFQPKFYNKVKRYKHLREFLPLFKKELIKLIILRKRPYFVLKGKKHYLKPKGLSLRIIELLFNSEIGKFDLNKIEIKILKYKLKIPILDTQNKLVVNANVYIDFKEALVAYNAKNRKKLKSLFKEKPFSLSYHSNKVISYIIEKCKEFEKFLEGEVDLL